MSPWQCYKHILWPRRKVLNLWNDRYSVQGKESGLLIALSIRNINFWTPTRYCFVENMLSNGVLHQGMYNVMQEWYKYIRENVHIQADLIGESYDATISFTFRSTTHPHPIIIFFSLFAYNTRGCLWTDETTGTIRGEMHSIRISETVAWTAWELVDSRAPWTASSGKDSFLN